MSVFVYREGAAEGVPVVYEEQLKEGEESEAVPTQKGGKKGKKSKRKNKAFDDW